MRVDFALFLPFMRLPPVLLGLGFEDEIIFNAIYYTMRPPKKQIAQRGGALYDTKSSESLRE